MKGKVDRHTVSRHVFPEPEETHGDNERTDEHQVGDVGNEIEAKLLVQLEVLDVDTGMNRLTLCQTMRGYSEGKPKHSCVHTC